MMQVIVDRLRGEFLEMPGLQLTVPQAERLCGISPPSCRAALDALVDAKFLCVRSNGRYARVTDGELHPSELTVDPSCRVGSPTIHRGTVVAQ